MKTLKGAAIEEFSVFSPLARLYERAKKPIISEYTRKLQILNLTLSIIVLILLSENKISLILPSDITPNRVELNLQSYTVLCIQILLLSYFLVLSYFDIKSASSDLTYNHMLSASVTHAVTKRYNALEMDFSTAESELIAMLYSSDLNKYPTYIDELNQCLNLSSSKNIGTDRSDRIRNAVLAHGLLAAEESIKSNEQADKVDIGRIATELDSISKKFESFIFLYDAMISSGDFNVQFINDIGSKINTEERHGRIIFYIDIVLTSFLSLVSIGYVLYSTLR